MNKPVLRYPVTYQGERILTPNAANLGAALPRPKGRHKPGTMNGLEARYEREVLIPRKAAGEVAWWCFEGVTLKLAERCRYTPDFCVLLADGAIELHEVKGGYTREDAMIKLRVCAQLYPFPIWLCRFTGKRGHETWTFTLI